MPPPGPSVTTADVRTAPLAFAPHPNGRGTVTGGGGAHWRTREDGPRPQKRAGAGDAPPPPLLNTKCVDGGAWGQRSVGMCLRSHRPNTSHDNRDGGVTGCGGWGRGGRPSASPPPLLCKGQHGTAPPPPPGMSLWGRAPAELCLTGGGGGCLEPKSPKGCVPKTAPINISFCKISFFPTMKSGFGGGGDVRPPPPSPTPGQAELFSKTLTPRLYTNGKAHQSVTHRMGEGGLLPLHWSAAPLGGGGGSGG